MVRRLGAVVTAVLVGWGAWAAPASASPVEHRGAGQQTKTVVAAVQVRHDLRTFPPPGGWSCVTVVTAAFQDLPGWQVNGVTFQQDSFGTMVERNDQVFPPYDDDLHVGDRYFPPATDWHQVLLQSSPAIISGSAPQVLTDCAAEVSKHTAEYSATATFSYVRSEKCQMAQGKVDQAKSKVRSAKKKVANTSGKAKDDARQQLEDAKKKLKQAKKKAKKACPK